MWGCKKCSALKVELKFGRRKSLLSFYGFQAGLAPLSSTISIRHSQTSHNLFLGQISGCLGARVQGKEVRTFWEMKVF